ncbi:hypothetical protein SAMN04487949_2113 [Halogranum gelatinilyticum]|uniref:Uncharacterized protein n=1 Tax=Halogranum gelatinilyticum TaxID=660521 RepID=A0A1G9UAK2_9EURY|nr:DUF5813 family protein [Halogranum gelatinilyticum]SDM56872.1 hypothetical protein SAMN04487949_2113 [Halogranum gelatinilyticum]
MSELPDRVRRAFRDHNAFEETEPGRYESVVTAFDGVVDVRPGESGDVEYHVTVRVPMLNGVTEDHVAEIVEEGWYETFALRVEDIGGLTAGGHDLDPDVEREGTEAVVRVSFADINERRGVDDAGAVVDYVEGTYVQGIIPGYEYTSPVTSLIDAARQSGGSQSGL